jgi:hypothetical protein
MNGNGSPPPRIVIGSLVEKRGAELSLFPHFFRFVAHAAGRKVTPLGISPL